MGHRIRITSAKPKRRKTHSKKRQSCQQLEATDPREMIAYQVLAEVNPSPAQHAAVLKGLESEAEAPTVMGGSVVNKLQRDRGNFYVQRVMLEVQSLKASGKPLGGRTCDEMEDSLGQPLDGVRVHTDGNADRLCRHLGAKSATIGQDILFRGGAFSPHTKEGRTLLAHELVHVVQQEGKESRKSLWDDVDLSVSNQLEQEAERLGWRIGQGKQIGPSELNGPQGGPAPSVQMQKEVADADEPPKTIKDPKDALGKVLGEWAKTKAGKTGASQMKTAALTKEELPKKVLLGIGAILAAMLANEMKVPKQAFELIPEIELGEDAKLKVKPIWKGTPGKAPKEWGAMVTLTIKWK